MEDPNKTGITSSQRWIYSKDSDYKKSCLYNPFGMSAEIFYCETSVIFNMILKLAQQLNETKPVYKFAAVYVCIYVWTVCMHDHCRNYSESLLHETVLDYDHKT